MSRFLWFTVYLGLICSLGKNVDLSYTSLILQPVKCLGLH